MRLWSLHPSYLDSKGLVALWREALLAQKVLLGQTKGYKNHPQLIRFRQSKDPVLMIGCYLNYVYLEAARRGYQFDAKKIVEISSNIDKLSVTNTQLLYEYYHLQNKLKKRSPKDIIKMQSFLNVHPIFDVIEGAIEVWEHVIFDS